MEEKKLKKHLEYLREQGLSEVILKERQTSLIYNFMPDLFPESKEIVNRIKQKAKEQWEVQTKSFKLGEKGEITEEDLETLSFMTQSKGTTSILQ